MARKKKSRATVISLNDHHDERALLEDVTNLAGCHTGGGAHVYTFADHYVISPKPLSKTAVKRAFHESELSIAEQFLKSGEAPYEVWDMCHVSADDIGQIEKRKRIKLQRNWFATGNAAAEEKNAGKA